MLRVFSVIVATAALGLGQTATTNSNGTVDLTSPALKAHASHPQLTRYGHGDKIADQITVSEAGAVARGIVTDGLTVRGIDEAGPGTFQGFRITSVTQKLTCLADAIVVGRSRASMSHLTINQDGIYSDFAFILQGVLKDNTAKSLKATKEIVVTRPGGKMNIGSGMLRTYEVEQGGYPALDSEKIYLIFLRYIPASSAYIPIDEFSTLVLTHEQWALARKAYSLSPAEPELAHNALENNMGVWLRACQQ